MAAYVPPVASISTKKAVAAPEPTPAQNQKAYQKALDNLSKHVESGDLKCRQEGLRSSGSGSEGYCEHHGGSEGHHKSRSQKPSTLSVRHSVPTILKRSKRASRLLKKHSNSRKLSQKVADDAIAIRQKSQEDLKAAGQAAGRLDTSRSMFNAIA